MTIEEEILALEADMPTSITLDDVLNDAAKYLGDQGFNGMAIGVKMARAELGGADIGEGYVRDMLEALDAADMVVRAARSDPNKVDLTELAEAVDKSINWGLEPSERMGNALLHILRVLHQVMFALEQPDGGLSPTLIENIRSLCVELGYEDLVNTKI